MNRRSPRAARGPLLALLAAAACLAGGCQSNSPGAYRDRDLDERSPFLVYQGLVKEGRTEEARAVETEALQHLEDLVEESAGRLLGQRIDLPTPSVADEAIMVEIRRRDHGTSRQVPLGHDAERFSPWTIKYLADHVGTGVAEALAAGEAAQVDEVVRRYLDKKLDEDAARARLRAIEPAVFGAAGVRPDEAYANESVLDAAVASMLAFTRRAIWPLFDGPTIHLNRKQLVGPVPDLLHVYGHELMHGIINRESKVPPAAVIGFLFDRKQSPVASYIEEATCEVFADLIVADIQARGLLPEPAPAAAPVPVPAVGPALASGASDPRTFRYLALDNVLARLSRLYKEPEVRFSTTLSVAGRYGQAKMLEAPTTGAPPADAPVARAPSGPSVVRGQDHAIPLESRTEVEPAIHEIFQRIPIAEFAALFGVIESLDDIDLVLKEARERPEDCQRGRLRSLILARRGHTVSEQ